MKTGQFRAEDLKLVKSAPAPDDPPLVIGDRCHLNSGSPSFLIVDAAEMDDVTVAWRFEERVIERKIPRACVRRAS